MAPKCGGFTRPQTKRIKSINQMLLRSDSLSTEHSAAAAQGEAADIRAASIKRFLSGP